MVCTLCIIFVDEQHSEKTKAQIREKVKGYLDRAEKIKGYLSGKKPAKVAADGSEPSKKYEKICLL